MNDPLAKFSMCSLWTSLIVLMLTTGASCLPWLQWLMRLFWRALEALDYLLRQTRLRMLDMVRRPGRRRDQPQGAVPGRPPGCRRAQITYVDHAAGHGTELFEKMWDIGGRADRLQPVAKISVLPRAR